MKENIDHCKTKTKNAKVAFGWKDLGEGFQIHNN